jgi:O-methyltransferase
MVPRTDTTAGAEVLYLDLLKCVLTRYLFGETYRPVAPRRGSLKQQIYRPIKIVLESQGYHLIRRVPFDPEIRAQGLDSPWPAEAETMIGLRRLDNLQECLTDVLLHGVPGDVIETGVWRGGAAIFARAVLKAHGVTDRIVWAADSFRGLPKPNPEQYPADANDRYWSFAELAVSLEEVKANFARYGLLDEQVRFLPGWFQDTLPSAPIDRLSVIRLDGDMYQSTIVALTHLYPKLEIGGYLIVDDYGAIPACRQAVDDFRAANKITEDLREVDWTGVYWQRRST